MGKLEQSICEKLEQGEDIVLATILSQAGSTPRTAGTKMMVCSDGKIAGTVGGGLVEAEVMKAASEIFRTGTAEIKDFNLTSAIADSMDMICGGRLKILLEKIAVAPANLELFRTMISGLKNKERSLIVAALEPQGETSLLVERCLIRADGTVQGDLALSESLRQSLTEKFRKERAPVLVNVENRQLLVEPSFVPGTVFLFGAGHVSQAVAALTRRVDFQTVVLDDRKEFANRERFKEADEIKVLNSFEDAFSGLEIDSDSYVVILTRGHSHDKTVLEQSLRTKAGYVGMIGSRRKRDIIYQKLLSEGFTQNDLNRVHSPIGLSIGAETPEEIAVSIVGELIGKRANM